MFFDRIYKYHDFIASLFTIVFFFIFLISFFHPLEDMIHLFLLNAMNHPLQNHAPQALRHLFGTGDLTNGDSCGNQKEWT